MVRLDKIIYMITSFKSLVNELEQDQYSPPKNDLSLDSETFMVLERMGVISSKNKSIKDKEKFIASIPFGREDFLFLHIKNHYQNICKISMPLCNICAMSKQCDYHNKKNYWEDIC